MSYFDDDRKGYSLGWFGILVLLIIAAVIGGAICLVGANYLGYLNPAAANNNLGISQQSDYSRLLTNNDEISVVSAVAKQVSPSVVQVSNFSTTIYFWQDQEIEAGTGSGLIIDAEGYIVTNYHVVANSTRLEVTLYDGTKLDAQIVGMDSRTDLAVLKVEATSDLSVAQLGDSDKLEVGEIAIAIGNPGGSKFANSVTVGYISGLNRMVESSEGRQYQLIQTDAAINPGNSGGPLVNRYGEVIGINSIKIASSSYEGMGFSIPSNTVKSIVEDLIQYKKVLRPGLGVVLIYDVTPAFAELNDLGVDYGVIVKPQPGSVAQQAGLKDYDIITAIDGKTMENSYMLQDEIGSRKIGDSVTVTVFRDGEYFELKVTLGELNS